MRNGCRILVTQRVSDDTLEEEYSDEISGDDEQVVSDGWELLSDPFIDVQAA